MKTLRLTLWMFIVVGLFAATISLGGAWLDWNELRRAYESWHRVVTANGDLRSLFLAESRQNIHRVNLFADVVWVLLGLIPSALGTIGLCVLRHSSDKN